MSTVMEKEFAHVEYSPKNRAIIVHWHTGKVNSEQYRMVMNEVLSEVEARQVSTLISDHRDMGMISLADEKWTLKEWNPKAEKTPLVQVRVIPSNNAFNKAATNSIVLATKKAHLHWEKITSEQEIISWVGTSEAA